MKNLLPVLLFIALLWAIFYGWSKGEKVAKFEENEVVLRGRVDSLQELANSRHLEAIRYAQRYQMAKDSLRKETARIGQITRKYENLSLHTPKRLTDAGIDSALSRLYPNR